MKPNFYHKIESELFPTKDFSVENQRKVAHRLAELLVDANMGQSLKKAFHKVGFSTLFEIPDSKIPALVNILAGHVYASRLQHKKNSKPDNQKDTMNKAYLLTLVTDQIKTVDVTFDHSVDPASPNLRTYTYLTLLDGLKPGDEVIVEAGTELKVVQVVEVHEDPEIDPNANFEYKWAISTKGSGVLAERDRLHKLQDEAVREIKKAQKTAQRKKLREEFKEYIGGETPKINFLEDNDS